MHGSEIELKQCASSKTSVKLSRKYFVQFNSNTEIRRACKGINKGSQMRGLWLANETLAARK